MRDDDLPKSLVNQLQHALDRSAPRLRDGMRDAALAAEMESLASALGEGGDDTVARQRRLALGETLGGIATRLR